MRCLKTLPYQLEGTVDIITPPLRDTFYSFEPIDITGLVITINVRGRLPITVDWRNLTVRPKYKDNRHTGSQIVDIVYSTMIGKLPVYIIEQEYSGLRVISPTSYSFPYGAEFHRGDVVIEGIFEHFGSEIIPEDELTFSIAEGTPITADLTELVITANNGVSTSIPIDIEESLIDLEVTPPIPSEIEWGTPLYYNGMEVYATYMSEVERRVQIPLNQCEISPPEGTLILSDDYTTINVTYKGLMASTFVTTIPHLDGLVIVEPPTKTVYTLKEEIDYTGLVVKFSYNGGSFFEDVEDYSTSPARLTADIIDFETREFTYFVIATKDDQPWVAEGQMLWDGTADQVVEFKDWCPWEYKEGYDLWYSRPDIVIYGWEDNDGNRITFPYKTTSLYKHNWEILGMHPLASPYLDLPDGEAYQWVHKPEYVKFILHTSPNTWNHLEFIGSDIQEWDSSQVHVSGKAFEVFLPYCTSFINKGRKEGGLEYVGAIAPIHLTINSSTFPAVYPTRIASIWHSESLTVHTNFEFEERLAANPSFPADYLYTPLMDGIHQYTVPYTIISSTYPSRTYYFAWYDGTGTFLTQPISADPPEVWHINSKLYENRADLILNGNEVITNLSSRIGSSLPFIKRIVIPPELEEGYKSLYGDYLSVTREDGVEVKVYFRAEDFDRWIPEYYEE